MERVGRRLFDAAVARRDASPTAENWSAVEMELRGLEVARRATGIREAEELNARRRLADAFW